MVTLPASARSLLVLSTSALCLLATQGFVAAQTAAVPPAVPGSGYRIAGTVVSKTDGHPLARARVIVRDTKDGQKFESLVTAEDGKFDFPGVPVGKYSLNGAKRGFITAAYDQHEQFSTAIVTGAGIDTEALVLRMAPAAVIGGKILDESGDPVRHASVTLYQDDHSSGVDQIHQVRGAQTDDQGEYEMPSLMPGTYFLSATAKPWYAVHPYSDPRGSRRRSQRDIPENFDRSLDVAYPLTYYADATEAESATPIAIRGGEHLRLEIHLNPVPSLHLFFRVPSSGGNSYHLPQLEQTAFEGSTFLQPETHFISPGLFEISGVPAGRYNVRVNRPGTSTQMNAVELTRDGEEIDTGSAEATSTVKLSVTVPGTATLPERLAVGLRSAHRMLSSWKLVDAKGEVELQQIPAGRYEVVTWGPPKPYSIRQMSAEGATVSGHSLIVAAGASVAVSLTLTAGSSNIEGTAKRADKPFAGALVVLVPKDPELNRDLFRRYQSDLDGTFSLHNVVPGSYTLLAIENGWDLDWSQPAVIAAYLSHGETIEVGDQVGRTMNVADAVDVQSK